MRCLTPLCVPTRFLRLALSLLLVSDAEYVARSPIIATPSVVDVHNLTHPLRRSAKQHDAAWARTDTPNEGFGAGRVAASMTSRGAADARVAQSSARRPALPADSVLIPPLTAGGRTWRVAKGENLQRAIDAAKRGDEIILDPAAIFEGSYRLPRKPGTGWIIIRSGGTIPEEGVRATHRNSRDFARIVATTQQPAISTQPGASGYRLIGLEITAASSLKRINALVALGDGSFAQNTEAKIPRDLILDRLWIHGHSALNIRRCVALNSAATAIIESTIEECHDDGFDSQAVWGWNGPGPFLIQNNYMEGSS